MRPGGPSPDQVGMVTTTRSSWGKNTISGVSVLADDILVFCEEKLQ